MKQTLFILFFVLHTTLSFASSDILSNPHVEDCGDRSLRECRDQTALIVIDMQPYFAQRNGAYKESANAKKLKEIMDQQEKAIALAKANGMPIVMIEYECGPCDPTSSNLMEAIGSYENSKVIKKTADGMFDSWNSHRDQLKEHLDSLGVDNLIITGANGGACVESSINGALRENYDVYAISNGIADFNYDEFIYPYTYEDDHWRLRRTLDECDNCSLNQYKSVDEVRLALSLDSIGSPSRKEASENNDNRGTPVEEKSRIRRWFDNLFRSNSKDVN